MYQCLEFSTHPTFGACGREISLQYSVRPLFERRDANIWSDCGRKIKQWYLFWNLCFSWLNKDSFFFHLQKSFLHSEQSVADSSKLENRNTKINLALLFFVQLITSLQIVRHFCTAAAYSSECTSLPAQHGASWLLAPAITGLWVSPACQEKWPHFSLSSEFIFSANSTNSASV